MNNFLKIIWRFIYTIKYRFQKVLIERGVRFNNHTQFEGMNRIGKYSMISNSKIGYATYLGSNVEMNMTKIGRYCSIARDVRIVSTTHPTSKYVSTSPVFFSTIKQCGFSFVSLNKFKEQKMIDNYCAIIGNDVWIGESAFLVGGIKVGNGVIIGAHAVVTKDVPDYAIVGGVPARIIKYRFTENQISFLRKLKWWDKDLKWIKEHADFFDDIESLIEKIKHEQ